MTEPLTLAVFGAAGGTGRELVAQTLSAGHRVRAVVRQRAARLLVGARLRGAGQIRRADLAAAMLATIGDRALIHKAVNIAC